MSCWLKKLTPFITMLAVIPCVWAQVPLNYQPGTYLPKNKYSDDVIVNVDRHIVATASLSSLAVVVVAVALVFHLHPSVQVDFINTYAKVRMSPQF